MFHTSVFLKGISKSFGSNRVLKEVDFTLHDGEIHALLGENGAGKSTLMNILGGVLKADAGEIFLNGHICRFDSPREAIENGIAFIHQELNLINDLSVYENLFIGEELKKGAFLRRKAMKEKAKCVLKSMDVDVDPDMLVSSLDASYKQIVEIARALLFDVNIIIMDEPTTSLTEPEIERVFKLMKTLKQKGVSIIFISHKLREVMRICDSYTVLRDGTVAGNGRIIDVNEKDLARLMVGHDIIVRDNRNSNTTGEEALSCENLTLEPYFSNISFRLHKGEILGFTGLLGDGRSELFQTVFGFRKGYTGTICVSGKPVRIRSTRHASSLGIGYVPKDRKENGIIKDLTILENGSIVIYENLRRFGLTDHRKEKRIMKMQAENLHIKYGDLNDLITSLSGGNQQKVVLSKWLSAESRILIFDNPTQGVDVGAKEDIYHIIRSLAQKGCAVVVLSSEAQEIIRLCDRTYVMYHGHTAGELLSDEMTENRIMLLATGAEESGIGGGNK